MLVFADPLSELEEPKAVFFIMKHEAWNIEQAILSDCFMLHVS